MSEQAQVTGHAAPPRRTAGWLVSLVFHAALLAVLALITWSNVSSQPEPERVISLGTATELSARAQDAGAAPDAAAAPASLAAALPAQPISSRPIQAAEFTPALMDETDPVGFGSSDPALATLGAPVAAPDSTASGEGLLSGTSNEFQQLLRGLGRRGLDVVLVIDATDSMEPYVEQARRRLHDVVAVLSGVFADAGGRRDPRVLRFGVVAFKDYGDDFGLDAVKSVPLQHDIDAVRRFIDGITVGGGGDIPEPIHKALEQATAPRMGWRRERQAIILLVGDAPVHSTGRQAASQLAADFARRYQGVINTIDVGGAGGGEGRRSAILPDFQQIAKSGKGAAFLLQDEQRFWSHLITLIFGERYARDVDLVVERYTKNTGRAAGEPRR